MRSRRKGRRAARVAGRPKDNQERTGIRRGGIAAGVVLALFAAGGVVYVTGQGAGTGGAEQGAFDGITANDMAKIGTGQLGGGPVIELAPEEIQAVAAAKKRAFEKTLKKNRKKGGDLETVGEAPEKSTGRGGNDDNNGSPPQGSANPTGNKKIAKDMLAARGWEDQWGCLERLWQKESGWNHRASNPSSGAYGIPQSLPGSKMASAGSDWRTNPKTQIKWGLGYIKGRYQTPCGAWSHSQSTGWY